MTESAGRLVLGKVLSRLFELETDCRPSDLVMNFMTPKTSYFAILCHHGNCSYKQLFQDYLPLEY